MFIIYRVNSANSSSSGLLNQNYDVNTAPDNNITPSFMDRALNKMITI